MSRSDGSTADYYVLPEGATQLQDLISHRDMNSQIGEIFRACYRYGIVSHSDKMRDAKKIRFYAQAEVERLERLIAVVEEPSRIISDAPSWADAPEWATHLMVANFDIHKEAKHQFAIKRINSYYDNPDTGEASRFITEGQPQLWVVHSDRPTSTAK